MYVAISSVYPQGGLLPSSTFTIHFFTLDKWKKEIVVLTGN